MGYRIDFKVTPVDLSGILGSVLHRAVAQPLLGPSTAAPTPPDSVVTSAQGGPVVQPAPVASPHALIPALFHETPKTTGASPPTPDPGKFLWPTGVSPFSPDLYARLGVSRDADARALKSAYRRMAMLLHPDRHMNKIPEVKAKAEEAFKNVSDAYEILSDAERRGEYDRYGSTRTAHQGVGMTNDELRLFMWALGQMGVEMQGGNPFAEYFRQHYIMAGCTVVFNFLVQHAMVREIMRDIFWGKDDRVRTDQVLQEVLLHYMTFRSTYPEFKGIILHLLQTHDWVQELLRGNKKLTPLTTIALGGVVGAFEVDADYLSELKSCLRCHEDSQWFTQTREHLLKCPLDRPGVLEALMTLAADETLPHHARVLILKILNGAIADLRVLTLFTEIAKGTRHTSLQTPACLFVTQHLGDEARSDPVVRALQYYAASSGPAKGFAMGMLCRWGLMSPLPLIDLASGWYTPVDERIRAVEILGLAIDVSEVREALLRILGKTFDKQEVLAAIRGVL